jgi:hypothetical protein
MFARTRQPSEARFVSLLSGSWVNSGYSTSRATRPGRAPLMPPATESHGHELATVVIAPSGPRISVVATTAFDYGANYSPAVRESDNDLLAHEFPPQESHEHSTECHDRRKPWSYVRVRLAASPARTRGPRGTLGE